MLRPLLAAAAAALVLAAPAKAAMYDDDAYWAFADKMQQLADKHWDEQDGYFHLGGGGSEPMSNSMQLLTYSVAAMQGHEGPARNDHRARILADRLVSSPAVRDQEDRRRPGARARLGELDDQQGQRPAPRLRRRGRGWSDLRLPRPRSAAAARRDGAEDPQRDPQHRPRLLLALPDDPVEPDQLVRADVLRRRPGDRRQHAAEARLLAAAQALLRRRARQRDERRQLRRRHALPLPARPHDQRHREPRLRRVREHRPDLHALLRPGATRRHGADERVRQGAHPPVDQARGERLLDPRRLHELGLRARGSSAGTRARSSA